MRWTRMLGFWAAAGLLTGCASLPSGPAPKSVTRGERREATLACARLCERHNDAAQARRIYQALIKENPKQVEPYHRLAVLAAKEGNFAEADAYFQKALAAGPATAELLSDMGYALYLQDRLAEAEKALRRAVEVDPNYLAAHNNLGLVLGQQGKLDAAMAAFRKAGTEAQAHANLAYVHATRGELDKAERFYSRALSLDQELRPAAEALLQVARHTGSIGRPMNLTPNRDAAEEPDDDLAASPSKPASQPRSGRAAALAASTRRKPTSHPRDQAVNSASAEMPGVTRLPANDPAGFADRNPTGVQAGLEGPAHAGITPPKHREPFSWRSQPGSTEDQAGTLVLTPNLTPEPSAEEPSETAASKRSAPQKAAEPKHPQLAQRHGPRRPTVKIVAHQAPGGTGTDDSPDTAQTATSAHAAGSDSTPDAQAASAVWISDDDAQPPAQPARRAGSAPKQRGTRQAAAPRPPRRGALGRLLLGDDEGESQSGFASASDAPQNE